jgi:hypothetical protein
MSFRAGSQRYSLAITNGPLINEDRQFLSVTVQDERQILISGEASPMDRPRLLCRELIHAWLLECGTPADSESWVDLMATVMRSGLVDLNTFGGELALISLQPGESPQPGAARIGTSTARQCAQCSQTIAGGSVAWRQLGPGVLEGRAFCEFCNLTTIWPEGTNARGEPACRILGEPKFERGDTTGIKPIGRHVVYDD